MALRCEEDEREKGRKGEWERRVFELSEIFMNRHSGFRLIRIQSSHKGTVIPSPGYPGCKMRQMTADIANPGSPGRRNLVPRNRCDPESGPLLNHFCRLLKDMRHSLKRSLLT
jgi:hypothetical protein